ncbi:aldolase/citrate lyase family protein [Rhodovulum sulfidophilum]|uniref:aldolase/citrate lyase family protein n=1 Tax=Rhodovulum sulfidophilum TaxID=35806 RepID=UPI001F3C18F7|nr:aldolase/citrate lyase family protein [Rhodovulum sulfidophilum]MCE8456995.1 aldolase/citrate lyase family protein [Rhodovulum sulfidophilum]
MAAQDARSAVIAMIEDAEALDRIYEIVATEGLDAIFIGRADLGQVWARRQKMAG